MLTEDQIKILLADYAREKDQRAALWAPVWQDVADFMLPARATFTHRQVEGANRRHRIFDTTAEHAIETLAGGLHGMFTSRSQRWFHLGLRPAARAGSQRAARESKRVNVWLGDVTDEMYGVLNSPHSQFHTQIDCVYQDIGAFGTSVLLMDNQHTDISPVVYHNVHMNSVVLKTNSLGMVDTIFRQFNWPLSQIVHKFGVDALPPKLADAYRKGQDPEEEVLYVVLPRHHARKAFIHSAREMPFATVWLLPAHKKALSEGGNRQFPYAVPRWRVRTGETYGTGPGLRMLPEVRMLNSMFQTVMKGAQKAVDPPLQAPDNGFIGPLRTFPNGISYYRSGSPDRLEPIVTGSRVDIGLEMLDRQREVIRAGFYNDAFDVTEDSDGVNVKATFTMARRDDRLRKLSPVVSRLDQELFQPVIGFLFGELLQQDRIPSPPGELFGENGLRSQIEIEYVSPVARAMRTTEADDIFRLLELASALGEIDPTALQNIDANAAVRLAGGRLFNVPASIMRDPKEVQALREQQDESAEAREMAETGAPIARALKDAASANRDLRAV